MCCYSCDFCFPGGLWKKQSEDAIGKFYLVAEGQAEIKELRAGADFKLLDTAFKEAAFRPKKNVLIAAIFRDGKHIVPSGNTCIRQGDQVIIASSRKWKIRSLNDIV